MGFKDGNRGLVGIWGLSLFVFFDLKRKKERNCFCEVV